MNPVFRTKSKLTRKKLDPLESKTEPREYSKKYNGILTK